MKRILLAAALMAAGAAMADDMVYGKGENVVRLFDRPCVHGGTLAILQPEVRSMFRNGRALVRGKDFYLCWSLTSQGNVHLVFEDGDEGEIPAKLFKRDEGI